METLDSSNNNGTPLTEEQLAYFTEQTRHAARHAVRRFARAATAGFLILLVGVGYNLHHTGSTATDGRKALVQSGRVVSVAGCNRDFDTITALRGVLVDARGQIKVAAKRGQIGPEQAADAKKFYTTQLDRLVLPDCRTARSLLTDNIDKLPAVPAPLFPKENGG